MLRTSTPADLPALHALWLACFGDDKAYINLYFTHYWRPERIYVLEYNGAVRAMCSWFGLELAGRPAAYFYAVATAPAYQGRGFCKQLMAYAQAELAKQGIRQFLLVPGQESLFRFYAALGYTAAGRIGSLTLTKPLPGDVHAISAKEYLRRRTAALPQNAVQYGLPELQYQKVLSQFSGGDLYAVGESGCAAVERLPEGRLICKELLGCQAESGGAQLLHHLRARQAIVRFPDDQGRIFCMGKNLHTLPCYLGLAFD